MMGNDRVKVVVLWGTMALRLFAEPYYRGMAKACETDFSLPLPGGGLRAVGATYRRLRRHLEAIQGDDVLIIVAHSQGGLVASLYVAEHPNSYMVGLGTPWAGAELARLTRLIPRRVLKRVQALKDMAPGSPFMQHLQTEVLPANLDRIRSVYTVPDLLVSARSAHLPGASNHCIVASAHRFRQHFRHDEDGLTVHHMERHRMGHIQEVLDKSIQDVIREQIDELILAHPFELPVPAPRQPAVLQALP